MADHMFSEMPITTVSLQSHDSNTHVTDAGNSATVEDQVFDEIPQRDSSIVPSQTLPTDLLMVPSPNLDVSNDIVAMESKDSEDETQLLEIKLSSDAIILISEMESNLEDINSEHASDVKNKSVLEDGNSTEGQMLDETHARATSSELSHMVAAEPFSLSFATMGTAEKFKAGKVSDLEMSITDEKISVEADKLPWDGEFALILKQPSLRHFQLVVLDSIIINDYEMLFRTTVEKIPQFRKSSYLPDVNQRALEFVPTIHLCYCYQKVCTNYTTLLGFSNKVVAGIWNHLLARRFRILCPRHGPRYAQYLEQMQCLLSFSSEQTISIDFPFDPGEFVPSSIVFNDLSMHSDILQCLICLARFEPTNSHNFVGTTLPSICALRTCNRAFIVLDNLDRKLDKEISFRLVLEEMAHLPWTGGANIPEKSSIVALAISIIGNRPVDFFALNIGCQDCPTMVLATSVEFLSSSLCHFDTVVSSCGFFIVLGVWDPGINSMTVTLKGHVEHLTCNFMNPVWDPGLQLALLVDWLLRMIYLRKLSKELTEDVKQVLRMHFLPCILGSMDAIVESVLFKHARPLQNKLASSFVVCEAILNVQLGENTGILGLYKGIFVVKNTSWNTRFGGDDINNKLVTCGMLIFFHMKLEQSDKAKRALTQMSNKGLVTFEKFLQFDHFSLLDTHIRQLMLGTCVEKIFVVSILLESRTYRLDAHAACITYEQPGAKCNAIVADYFYENSRLSTSTKDYSTTSQDHVVDINSLSEQGVSALTVRGPTKNILLANRCTMTDIIDALGPRAAVITIMQIATKPSKNMKVPQQAIFVRIGAAADLVEPKFEAELDEMTDTEKAMELLLLSSIHQWKLLSDSASNSFRLHVFFMSITQVWGNGFAQCDLAVFRKCIQPTQPQQLTKQHTGYLIMELARGCPIYWQFCLVSILDVVAMQLHTFYITDIVFVATYNSCWVIGELTIKVHMVIFHILYSNLEDKVLNSGGSNVMNHVMGLEEQLDSKILIAAPGLGINMRFSSSTTQPNKSFNWDPG